MVVGFIIYLGELAYNKTVLKGIDPNIGHTEHHRLLTTPTIYTFISILTYANYLRQASSPIFLILYLPYITASRLLVVWYDKALNESYH